MKKLLLVIGIMTALFATSCKKDTSVSGGGDTPQGNKSECFYFEAVDAGVAVGMENRICGDVVLNVSLEYSTDKTKWSPFVVGETSVTLANAGDRVYIRANGTNDKFYLRAVGKEDDIHKSFTATGNVKVGGNIMYLLDGTGTKNNFDTLLNKSAFRCLFKEMTSLTDASSLILPATTLAEDCYDGMFAKCTSLTSAPSLPATTLAEACYGWMFQDCTSLINAPELSATALAEDCYEGMFYGCISLTVAPPLPATTLSDGCYSTMFTMCLSLQSVEVNFAEWWNDHYSDGWLKLVSATGTFTCPAALDVSIRDEKHVPQGWTIVTK